MLRLIKKRLQKHRVIKELDTRIEIAIDYVFANYEGMSLERSKKVREEMVVNMDRRNKVRRLFRRNN